MSRSTQRGVGLLEPLIAICILAFGILGLAQFQLNLLAQNADARSRLTATSLTEELLAQVTADPANAACYSSAAANGACSFAPGLLAYQEWAARANFELGKLAGIDKSRVSVKSALDATAQQFTVVVTWGNKNAGSTRRHIASTSTASSATKGPTSGQLHNDSADYGS